LGVGGVPVFVEEIDDVKFKVKRLSTDTDNRQRLKEILNNIL